jgi:hypothetical protein
VNELVGDECVNMVMRDGMSMVMPDGISKVMRDGMSKEMPDGMSLVMPDGMDGRNCAQSVSQSEIEIDRYDRIIDRTGRSRCSHEGWNLF